MSEEESPDNVSSKTDEQEKSGVNEDSKEILMTDPSEIMERLGRTKKRILIELYRDSVGYKRLSKIIGVGLDTVRSHIRTGKYSRSLLQLGLVERGEKGWQLTPLGLQVTELLQQDNEFKAFFFD
jgi:DNA-binding transcriptional ArsR family regulator